MKEDDLEEWDEKCIDEYYKLIEGVHNRITADMNAVHSRATSVLAVIGVILALTAAFIVPASTSDLSLVLLIVAMAFLFSSMLFIVLTIHPAKVMVIDICSHQPSSPPLGSDYINFKKDHSKLKKQMLRDLLICSESEENVYLQRQGRYALALRLLIIAMCLILSSFVLYALA